MEKYKLNCTFILSSEKGVRKIGCTKIDRKELIEQKLVARENSLQGKLTAGKIDCTEIDRKKKISFNCSIGQQQLVIVPTIPTTLLTGHSPPYYFICII